MSAPVVTVDKISFRYTINNASAKSLKQALINRINREHSDVVVHALTDITFELRKGDVLGIVGRNGAGKSTLLKVLVGILPPSTGAVKVHGRIAPLIELGAGFSPELTGKENIELFGTLLGHSRKFMRENAEAIASWAGLLEFIDLPIRTYSTGMLARLGFSIATFQESQLLVIDETLSVGDSEFQNKSLSRIESLMREGEVTVLVSHDLSLIEERTTQVIWLDHGRQMMCGDPKEVINAYREF
jgi:ABC-type polysaccharide/polyol phosphate transport system ATPase subunit